jgi:hypothetical protein
MKIGALVRSTYRARWVGVVLDLERTRFGDQIALVKPLRTSWGAPQGGHVKARWIGVGWLEPVPA